MCVFLVQLKKNLERLDTYSAQRNALSKARRDPPTNGRGGRGSLAIHYPSGILTAFSPLDAMKLKSLSVMNVRQ